MNPRRQSTEHQEAVARRLALLSAELAAVRSGPPAPEERSPEESGPEERGPAEHEPAELRPGPPTWRQERPSAPAVPVPGRHAARRVGSAVADALPETLRGRALLGPGQVAVVAVLVALGLAATCWWVVRSDSGEVVAPVAPAPAGDLVSAESPDARAPGAASAPASPRPVGATGSPSAAGAPVTVDVTGKVRRPGIAVLDAGARVVDALEAAGGARPGVDLSALNLARPLVDGEQILVGVPTPPGLVASAAPAAGATAGPLVNLNTASQAELETLPDVGPVTAEAIIAWRTEHGGYSAVEELLEVDGIGDVTLSKLAPHVTV
jgi:competence protein ComEA